MLGTGGMGTVYLVQHTLLGKDFALKVLDLHKRADVAVRRFQLEARTAAQLRHPNLVEVHDFGVCDEVRPYLVMDYVDGLTLAQFLKQKGSLSVDYVVTLAIQVGFALMYAHSNGVVHRDVKPENIILLQPDDKPDDKPGEGTVKVLDFGIAKLMQSEDGQIQELTRTGEVFGSPIYMSPEQCQGMAVDRRADIYSLGCVIFECLTGSPPFLAESAMATMIKRLTAAPVSLREGSIGQAFPQLLETIVQKMLAVDPAKRYQDFDSVIQDLMRLQRGENDVANAPVSNRKEKQADFALSKREIVLVSLFALMCCLTTATVDNLFVLKIQRANLSADVIVQPKFKDNAVDDFLVLAPKLHPPTSKTSVDSKGQRQVTLEFPYNYGTIKVGNAPETNAWGKVVVPERAIISLCLNPLAAEDPEILKRLTNLSFSNLELEGKALVSDISILPLEKIRFIQSLSLRNCAIRSLKPIYNNETIRCLYVPELRLPNDELLKLKSFPSLTQLHFGPLADPSSVLDGLSKFKTVESLNYQGPVEGDTFWKARGLNSFDAELLAKMPRITCLKVLNCPQFDNACLRKLLALKKLTELEVDDCAITAAAIPTLKSLRLKHLSLTTATWTKKDEERLHASVPNVEIKTPQQVRRVEMRVKQTRELQKFVKPSELGIQE